MAQLTSYLTSQKESFLTSFLETGLFDPLTLSPAFWFDGTDEDVMTLGVGNEINPWDSKPSASINAVQPIIAQQAIFKPNSILDVDPQYGEITGLKTINNQILMAAMTRWSPILFGPYNSSFLL